MRPALLHPLFVSLESLAGVGPKMAERLHLMLNKPAGTARLIDLLLHLPVALADRRHSPSLAATKSGDLVTYKIQILQHQPARNRRAPYRIFTRTEQGEPLLLAFFAANATALEKRYPIDAKMVVSGKVDFYEKNWQILHPERVGREDEWDHIATLEPIYRLSAGLTSPQVSRFIRLALSRLPELPEWHDLPLLKRESWPSWLAAMQHVHQPKEEQDLSPLHPARCRLAYDELLAQFLAIQIVRGRETLGVGRAQPPDQSLRSRALALLPFTLTADQKQALKEIDGDMAKPKRMVRLLQGDVGSGKTIVGWLAMLNAIAQGTQAALMAPTEILARQHFAVLEKLSAALNISCTLCLGRGRGIKEADRQKTLASIAAGEYQILIGTHALLDDALDIPNLGMIVVDEQQRFGVQQRLKLTQKSLAPDLLLMTATPIPRSLCLTFYGDLDISILRERPPGRLPIDTRLISASRIPDLRLRLAHAMEEGAQIYWVCPLVEENETLALTSVAARAADLAALYPEKVGFLHGQMKTAEKNEIMQKFRGGDLRILVATSVIEVGVDVPQASLMIIEHAERFGLSALHQLRGRVGRGNKAAHCLLLHGAPLSEMARQRLEILRDSQDGFAIAEMDLKLRGAGEVLGFQQSGAPEYRCVNLTHHSGHMTMAHDDARVFLARDAELQSRRGEALKTLLYLQEQDAAIDTLKAG